MPKASEYRKRADECAELARTVRIPAQRTMLLHIADTWLRLASDAEDNERGSRISWPVPPATKLM
jgi:hypothetical protein